MKRVLVVDDEEGIRTFIEAVLDGEGYKVSTAGDGIEASQLLERQSFHLMITDLVIVGCTTQGSCAVLIINQSQP